MAFSPQWEDIYLHRQIINRWPWSDLITKVMRYTRDHGPAFKVLELGAGNGTNIPFFKSLGVDYHGIEGSESAVGLILTDHPDLRHKMVPGDFTRDIPFDISFDLIFDRGAMTCNSTADIKSCIRLINGKLKPGGLYMGISWFSNENSDSTQGTYLHDDPHTVENVRRGMNANLGRIHFSDKQHLLELFAGFEFIALDHFTRTHELPNPELKEGMWNFVVRKREMGDIHYG